MLKRIIVPDTSDRTELLNNPNFAVITSRNILENHSPILEAIHNTDGIW